MNLRVAMADRLRCQMRKKSLQQSCTPAPCRFKRLSPACDGSPCRPRSNSRIISPHSADIEVVALPVDVKVSARRERRG